MKKYVFLLLSCALFSTAHAQKVVVPESVAPDMSFPPLGVPADMLSAVKKCPNLFMLWGYVIPNTQAAASISMG